MNQWQTVTGTYVATHSSTTFALHSEGDKSAYFDNIEVVNNRDINSRNHPTTGATSITVYGSGFAGGDATIRTRSGGTAAEATLWRADTACLSRFPAGVMATHYSAMSIEEWLSTLTDAASFDVPSVSLPHVQNHETISALIITTGGSNFGIIDSTSSQRLGISAVETSRWNSDTTLTWCVSHIALHFFAVFGCHPSS